ncbi:MAG TPA: hypothetical protein VES20_18420, partial [Bryobacteraceae bacterium]|nr:hypothetical protein [Bryobacteraceae bacterium]
MTPSNSLLLTFLLNSLWQLPLFALLAAALTRLMGIGPARYRHAVWLSVLVLAVLLPLAGTYQRGEQTDAMPLAAFPTPAAMEHAAAHPLPLTSQPPAVNSVRTVDFAGSAVLLIAGLYLGFVSVGFWRLVRALRQTSDLRSRAIPVTAPSPAVRAVWNRCREAFHIRTVELCT